MAFIAPFTATASLGWAWIEIPVVGSKNKVTGLTDDKMFGLEYACPQFGFLSSKSKFNPVVPPVTKAMVHEVVEQLA